MKKISKKEAVKKALRNETCSTCAYTESASCTFYSPYYWYPFPKERTCQNWHIIKEIDFYGWTDWIWCHEYALADSIWLSWARRKSSW